MNSRSRSQNALLNALANVTGQVITLIFSFLTRIVFIKAFGENYLGINGLFSNILSVLSLAELGVSSAIVYSMYKPIAEKDYYKLSALMTYYKKLYQNIGVFVAAIGLLVVPFLKYLVKVEADIGNVTVYYLLYLLNTVSSYFLVYKTSILIADQKSYIIKICTVFTVAIQFLVLTFAAMILRNYYIYLSLQIGFSIINNYICSRMAVKQYPFIKIKAELGEKEKKTIWTNILSMFSYQVGNVILNNTDNILTSVIVNTVVVGYYSNYSMVISSIATFLQLIFTSLQASIGNLVVTGDEEKQYDIFNIIQLLSFWATLFCCVSFAMLFQDCITILYTDHYLLDYRIVLICVFNFYIQFIMYPIYCYRSTIGLFKQTRWVMLFTSIINLILSIVFGQMWGLAGILIATGVSRLVSNFWYEPLKLYKVYFKKPVVEYYIQQLVYAVSTVIIVMMMAWISSYLKHLNLYLRFFIKVLACIFIPNSILLIKYKNNMYFQYLVKAILARI